VAALSGSYCVRNTSGLSALQRWSEGRRIRGGWCCPSERWGQRGARVVCRERRAVNSRSGRRRRSASAGDGRKTSRTGRVPSVDHESIATPTPRTSGHARYPFSLLHPTTPTPSPPWPQKHPRRQRRPSRAYRRPKPMRHHSSLSSAHGGRRVATPSTSHRITC
jgi:hypothetical protein